MRVLVACERSQRVCAAFRALGHEAYSCDVEPTHGDPEWHIQGDCLPVVQQPDWDLIVAFPPCTHLAASGAQYWPQKAEVQREAIAFVRAIYDAPCPRVAIENPVGVLSTRWRKPDQISKLPSYPFYPVSPPLPPSGVHVLHSTVIAAFVPRSSTFPPWRPVHKEDVFVAQRLGTLAADERGRTNLLLVHQLVPRRAAARRLASGEHALVCKYTAYRKGKQMGPVSRHHVPRHRARDGGAMGRRSRRMTQIPLLSLALSRHESLGEDAYDRDDDGVAVQPVGVQHLALLERLRDRRVPCQSDCED